MNINKLHGSFLVEGIDLREWIWINLRGKWVESLVVWMKKLMVRE